MPFPIVVSTTRVPMRKLDFGFGEFRKRSEICGISGVGRGASPLPLGAVHEAQITIAHNTLYNLYKVERLKIFNFGLFPSSNLKISCVFVIFFQTGHIVFLLFHIIYYSIRESYLSGTSFLSRHFDKGVKSFLRDLFTSKSLK